MADDGDDRSATAAADDGIDRRDFLKIAGGGVVGAGIAGLLPSLLPDSASALDTDLADIRNGSISKQQVLSQEIEANVIDAVDVNDVLHVPAEKGEEGIRDALATVRERGGGKIVLGKGTFDISNNLVLPSNVWVEGQGMGVTELRMVDDAEMDLAGMFYVRDESHIKISDIELNGNKQNQRRVKNKFGHRYGFYSEYTDYIVLDSIHSHDFWGYGIDPHEPSRYVRVTNCIVEDNGFDPDEIGLTQGDTYDGITMDHCDHSICANNICRNNARHGINIVTTTGQTIVADNVVVGNGAGGLVVQHPGTDNIAITGNVVDASGGEGIRIGTGREVSQSRHITLTGNVVRDSRNVGIVLHGSPYVAVVGNTLVGNGSRARTQLLIGEFEADSEEQVVSHHNTIVGNQFIPGDATTQHQVAEQSPDCGPNVIAGNMMEGSDAAILQQHPDTVVGNNLSGSAERSGTAAIGSNESGADITVPGLLVLDPADLSVTPLTPLGDATSFWVADTDDDERVRIVVDQEPGEEIRFGWEAR